MVNRQTSLPSTMPLTFLLFLALIFSTLPSTVSAASDVPCADANPCKCTVAKLISTLSPIPDTLLPPTAWAPVTDIIPIIAGLLDRPPPSEPREASFLREIESATNAMFASQFAAHAVAYNARIAWRRSRPLIQQIRSGKCADIPELGKAPTADVFANRFPPTHTVVSTLISYDALHTVIKPYKRALRRTETVFSNFSRNEDVKDVVESAVKLFGDIAASGFDETVTAEKFAKIDDLDLNSVFNMLVYRWYNARKRSERRIFQSLADQVEPLKRVSICNSGPVNSVTCAICT